MPEKVYFKDCKNRYFEVPYNWFSGRCVIVVDDYFSPQHQIFGDPGILNRENNCKYFIQKTE